MKVFVNGIYVDVEPSQTIAALAKFPIDEGGFEVGRASTQGRRSGEPKGCGVFWPGSIVESEGWQKRALRFRVPAE